RRHRQAPRPAARQGLPPGPAAAGRPIEQVGCASAHASTPTRPGSYAKIRASRTNSHTGPPRLEVYMHWDVKQVRPLDNYEIHGELRDGTKGTFDLKPYLDHGVFKELRNKAYFAQVDVVLGAVT